MAGVAHPLLVPAVELLVRLALLATPQRPLAACRDVPPGRRQLLVVRQLAIDLQPCRPFVVVVERFELPRRVPRDARPPGVVASRSSGPGSASIRQRRLDIEETRPLLQLLARVHLARRALCPFEIGRAS